MAGSVHLTRANFPGPSLHQNIKGRSAPAQNPCANSDEIRSANRERSVDIDADPLSSDEDSTCPQTDVIHEIKAAPGGKKETAIPRRGGTGKRGYMVEEPAQTAPLALPPRLRPLGVPRALTNSMADSKDDLSWYHEPRATKRQKIMTYRKQTPAATKPLIQPDLPSLAPVPDVPGFGNRGLESPVLRGSSVPLPKIYGESNCVALATPPALENMKPKATHSVLSIPDCPPFEPVPSLATAIDIPSTFVPPASVSLTRPQTRSESPLSSTKSDVSNGLYPERRNNLTYDDSWDDTDDYHTECCPLCAAPVERFYLEEFNLGRRKDIRAQQNFCTEHKIRDAQKQWDIRGYPDIRWDLLEIERLTPQCAALTDILQRTAPSHYLSELDSASTQNRRSRRDLQRYLKEGIVDIVHHGYYGPRGARIISNTISLQMAELLNAQAQRDRTVRIAGVGGYISAVLVPEVITRLVMEDLKIAVPTEARRIMAESTEIGELLNGDDNVDLIGFED